MQGFVSSILAHRFEDCVESPSFHIEMWELFCSAHKYCAVAAPRKHAKTTAVTLSYGLACSLFRERRYTIIVSDTEGQAVQFLANIKMELQENEALIDLFGIKRDEKGIVKFLKDSETDIIVECSDGHKFRFIAKGAEQKLRGLNWNGTRPDLILCDDMENDELVMNKERRDKLKRWFLSALMPCMSMRGIIRMVGTILHMDSLLEQFMPRSYDKFTVKEPLKEYSTRASLWKSIRWKAHNEDFTEILWPKAFTKGYFQELKKDYEERGVPDLYSQEFLNVPIDESNTYFRRGDFLPIREEDKKSKLNYYITADLAISQEQRADYSVFLVAGVDDQKRIHVVDIIRDRIDGRDIVEMILALQRTYEPEAFGIEEMQVTKAIGPFLNESMLDQNTFPTLYKLKPGGKDKPSRGRSIQARMRTKTIKFDKEAEWYPEFENELMLFSNAGSRAKHDDQFDCFAYLGLMLDKLMSAPTPEEDEEEHYFEELNSQPLGRSMVTGY